MASGLLTRPDKYEIQMGEVSYSDTPNGFYQQNVIFPKAFSGVPKVLINYNNVDSGEMPIWGTREVTKTQFTIGSWSTYGSSIYRKFNWIAIYERP